VQIARPAEIEAKRAIIGHNGRPGVVQGNVDVGQGSGGGALAQELVQFAKRQLASAQHAAQANAVRPDTRYAGRQAANGDVHLNTARHQVGTRRVAEHDILDPLCPEANGDEAVAHPRAASGKLPLDQVFGQGRALDPQAANRKTDDGANRHDRPAQLLEPAGMRMMTGPVFVLVRAQLTGPILSSSS
jgi:hypothetical protein